MQVVFARSLNCICKGSRQKRPLLLMLWPAAMLSFLKIWGQHQHRKKRLWVRLLKQNYTCLAITYTFYKDVWLCLYLHWAER